MHLRKVVSLFCGEGLAFDSDFCEVFDAGLSAEALDFLGSLGMLLEDFLYSPLDENGHQCEPEPEPNSPRASRKRPFGML